MSLALDVQARHEATVDLMRMGLLIEQYHAEHGAYGESLDGIATPLGGVPWDPYTSESYRYTHSAGGFSLYSVGPDQEHDGGHMPQTWHEGDWIWRGVRETEKGTPPWDRDQRIATQDTLDGRVAPCGSKQVIAAAVTSGGTFLSERGTGFHF